MAGLGKALEWSCFQLLFPQQSKHLKDGVLGFPLLNPSALVRRQAEGPCEHAAHVSQCLGSSLALGAPLVPSGTQPSALTHGDRQGKARALGTTLSFPGNEFTPGLLHSPSLAQAQLLCPCLWLL